MRLFLSLLILMVTLSAGAEQTIQIENAWIREAPPTVDTLAGYLSIKNNSDETLTLICANSPDFRAIEFHESKVENGFARMRRVEEISIPAGSSYHFEPGGFHFMLFGKQTSIKSGDLIKINLIFKEHDTLSVDATVRKVTHSDGH